jgi:hypothetical protein
MKLLYIGHYRESGGWAKTSLDHILCLDRAGVDVVCRSIDLTPHAASKKIPERIQELEKKDLQNIDYCIQSLLPHHIIGTGKFKKNIAIFVSENSTVKHIWFDDLRQVDEVWVPNSYNKEVLERDGIKNVKVIPYAFDLSTYDKSGKQISLYPIDEKYKFYFIGSTEGRGDISGDRKNLSSLLKAYYSEFKNGEQVCLVIKFKLFNKNPEESKNMIDKEVERVRSSMRMYKDVNKYPQHVVWSDEIDDEMIHGLHRTCDCYVTMSHGEGWDVPAFEAMCYGNTPICPKEGGHLEYIDDNNLSTGKLLNGVYNVCDNLNPAFDEIGTGREEWFCASESEMKKSMRYYYEHKDDIDRSAGIKQAEKFSYENVAECIKENLK